MKPISKSKKPISEFNIYTGKYSREKGEKFHEFFGHGEGKSVGFQFSLEEKQRVEFVGEKEHKDAKNGVAESVTPGNLGVKSIFSSAVAGSASDIKIGNSLEEAGKCEARADEPSGGLARR